MVNPNVEYACGICAGTALLIASYPLHARALLWIGALFLSVTLIQSNLASIGKGGRDE